VVLVVHRVIPSVSAVSRSFYSRSFSISAASRASSSVFRLSSGTRRTSRRFEEARGLWRLAAIFGRRLGGWPGLVRHERYSPGLLCRQACSDGRAAIAQAVDLTAEAAIVVGDQAFQHGDAVSERSICCCIWPMIASSFREAPLSKEARSSFPFWTSQIMATPWRKER
jgi:hypothetical protein